MKILDLMQLGIATMRVHQKMTIADIMGVLPLDEIDEDGRKRIRLALTEEAMVGLSRTALFDLTIRASGMLALNAKEMFIENRNRSYSLLCSDVIEVARLALI